MTANDDIKICAMVPYPFDTVPGQRFRIEQWEPFLLEKGISVDYFRFADERLIELLPKKGNIVRKSFRLLKGIGRRIRDISRLSQYDVVYLYRTAAIVGPAIFERLIKLLGKPIVFDFDDAIFLTDTAAANGRFGWAKFSGKTSEICRLSDHVIVGNSYLAEYAGRFNSKVTIIPSGVDTVKFKPRTDRQESGKTIVGWTGSSTSQTHLELFNPILQMIFANRNDVELHVHSDREPLLPGTPFVWHRWTTENEVEVLSSFDIGIMPIPDDEWSRGKCAMKALLYMSLGIPAICSDVGANRDVISHGVNGLLCNTPDDWVSSVNSLANDSEMRKLLGNAGRRTIEERFSAGRCASLFYEVVVATLTSGAPKLTTGN